MAGFSGGSAWAMCREVADGYVSVTERSFRSMTPAQLNKLSHEIDRYLRELRGGATAGEPLPDLKKRQHRIQRLNQVMIMLRAFRQKTRK